MTYNVGDVLQYAGNVDSLRGHKIVIEEVNSDGIVQKYSHHGKLNATVWTNNYWLINWVKIGRQKQQINTTEHQWKQYVGFTEAYEYCDCGCKGKRNV